MPATATRARLHVPTWLIAALAGAALATGATVLIETSTGSPGGAAAHGGAPPSQPPVCIQTTPNGPNHC